MQASLLLLWAMSLASSSAFVVTADLASPDELTTYTTEAIAPTEFIQTSLFARNSEPVHEIVKFVLPKGFNAPPAFPPTSELEAKLTELRLLRGKRVSLSPQQAKDAGVQPLDPGTENDWPTGCVNPSVFPNNTIFLTTNSVMTKDYVPDRFTVYLDEITHAIRIVNRG